MAALENGLFDNSREVDVAIEKRPDIVNRVYNPPVNRGVA